MKTILQIVGVVALFAILTLVKGQDNDQDSEEEFYLNHGINITKLPLTGLKLYKPMKEDPGWMTWLPLGEKLTGSPASLIVAGSKVGYMGYLWVDENLSGKFQPKMGHERLSILVVVCETPKQTRQLWEVPVFTKPQVVDKTLRIGDALYIFMDENPSDESNISYLRFFRNNVVVQVMGKVKDWTPVKVARLIDKHLQETAFKGKPDDIKRPKIEKFHTDKKVLKAEPGEGCTVTIRVKDTQKILAVQIDPVSGEKPHPFYSITIPTHQEFEFENVGNVKVEVKIKEEEKGKEKEKEYEVEVKMWLRISSYLPGVYKLYANAINESNVASEDAIIEIEVKEEDKKQ